MELKPGYSDKIGLMLSGNVEVLRSLQADSCVLSQVSILIESICQSLQASSKLIVCGNGGFDTFFSRRLRGIAKSEDVLVAFTTFGKLYWVAEKKWRKGRSQ